MVHFFLPLSRSHFLNLGLLATFVLLSIPVLAQKSVRSLGVQTSFFRPSGDYGKEFKGTPGIEGVLRFGELDEEMNTYASLGYYAPGQREASMNRYFSYNQNGRTVLVSERMVYTDYRVVPISLGVDFSASDFPVNPMLGVEATANVIFIGVEEYRGTQVTYERNWVTSSYSVGARYGIKYQMGENMLFLLGGSKIVGIDDNEDFFSLWKGYFSVFVKL